MSITDCVFCDFDMYAMVDVDGETICRVIWENDAWIVVPTLGAFIGGYVLLVAKRHSRSGYYCDNEERTLLNLAIKCMSDAFQDIYGDEYAYVFEHGSVGERYRSACCVDHTHLHMFPTNVDIYHKVLSFFINEYTEHSSINEVYEYIEKKGIQSYLMFGDVKQGVFALVDTTESVYPSQFLRQVIYGILVGEPSDYGWDWRRYAMLDKVQKIAMEMKNYFRKKDRMAMKVEE